MTIRNSALAACATLVLCALACGVAQAKPYRLSVTTAYRQSVRVAHDRELARSEFNGFDATIGNAAGHSNGCERLGRRAVLCSLTFVASAVDDQGDLLAPLFKSAEVLVRRPSRNVQVAELID